MQANSHPHNEPQVHPHNDPKCQPSFRIKNLDPEVVLTFDKDGWYTGEDDTIESTEMPDLRAAFAERRRKIQEMDELEWIESRLRREDEIQEILALSGMSHGERQRRLTLIETTARELKNEFKSMICKLTTLDAKVDALVDSAREYEKAVMYKPGIAKDLL